MPAPTFEYETVMINPNNSDMNAAINAEVAEGWMVLSLTPFDTYIIILFMRTIATS